MPKDTSKGSTKKKSAAGKKACTICGDDISPQGFAAHLKKCKREKDEQETLLEYEKDVYGRALALLRGTLKSDSTPPDHEDDITPGPELELDAQPEISAPHTSDKSTTVPNSNRPTKIRRVDDPSHTHQASLEPWLPFFTTHADFLVSEIILEGSLNKGLSDRLLEIFKSCHAGRGRVTLSNFSEVETAWARASVHLTPCE